MFCIVVVASFSYLGHINNIDRDADRLFYLFIPTGLSKAYVCLPSQVTIHLPCPVRDQQYFTHASTNLHVHVVFIILTLYLLISQAAR